MKLNIGGIIMNLSYMGLETGHWYDGDCGWRIYVANETVCLHFEGQCNDFDFLRQMQGFRDYVNEALESGKYKENEKYLSKSLKCYNLWILDFLSKVRLNENFEPVAGKYLRGENWDFDITFEEILRNEEEILKEKDFFIYLLKKEHLFKKLENYEYIFFDAEKQTAYMKFEDYVIQIGYYISNEYEKYYYSFSVLNRNENIKGNSFGSSDLNKAIKLYQEMQETYQEVKNILGKTSYKHYLKMK